MRKNFYQSVFSLILSGICLWAVSCCGKPEVQLYLVDPLVKYFPETAAFLELEDTLECAAGQHVEFQLALRSFSSLTCVEVSCPAFSSPGASLADVRCGRVGYVGIGEPAGDVGHDALRSATGLYPDPILTDGTFDVPAGQTTCVWITVGVPADAPAGLYETTVTLSGRHNGRRVSLHRPLCFRVWPVSMEKPSFKSVNWNFDFDRALRLWNGGEPVAWGSDLYWQYMSDMAAALRETYQNCTSVPLFGLVDMSRDTEGRYAFDFSRFNETVRFYHEAGVMDLLQGGEIGHRIEPSWLSGFGLFVPTGEGDAFETLPVEDPRTVEFYRAFLPALMADLEANGWADHYVQKVCDEPIDANADGYRAIIRFVKGIVPSLRVMEALQTTRLAGAMDIWVPQLDTWHNHYDFFRERQRSGESVWFYTCCFPRGEYPNRFIEQPLLKGRILYWMAFKYGAEGHLHWGFNYWNEHPYRQANNPFASVKLPGGDCWIVYPGYRKFERSIRFEAMRDGIEDYTLLSMLSAKDPDRARELCDRMVTNWWVYVTDPDAFRQVRHDLLESLTNKTNE